MRKLLFLLLALLAAQAGLCIEKVKVMGGIYSRVTSRYLPRFVMFTVKYSFDFKPKKHK